MSTLAFLDEYQDSDISEILLAQTTALLAQRGDDQAVALLVDVQSMSFARTDELLREEQSGYGYGSTRYIYARVALLDVEDHLVTRFTPDVRARLLTVLTYVAERHDEHNFRYLEVRPALPQVDGDWRTTYAARLQVDRPTNQGRRERSITSNPIEDGLAFASTAELTVYRALRRLQQSGPEDRTITVLPLPGARLRAGHTWTPDFVVIGNGRAMIVEIDGPHHRAITRRADDANRDLQWRRCGVNVVRLSVEDVDDAELLEQRLREEAVRNLYRST